MKSYKAFIAIATTLAFASCSDIDDQTFEGNTQLREQTQEVIETLPERGDASFSGMFSIMGKPHGVWPTGGNASRADDFGYPAIYLSLDAEGSDLVMSNNDYNWFSAASELQTRNANYANPYIRYVLPYRQIGTANEIIASYPEGTESPAAINHIAQARAMRAFAYMTLAPYFQFSYLTAKDQPCIPILKDGADYTNNPRATVEETYDYILEDLNYAVDHLTADRTEKSYINQNVAYGLRARVNLIIGKYAEAAQDAEKAMQGFTPATIAEVSVPAFCKLSEHNWMWGVNITDDMAQSDGYPTPASWFSAFSGDGYAAATGNTPRINNLLYDKIPATDVRKGWWLDENKHTPNWANITWAGAVGDEIADLVLDDGSKVEFEPYTNVKFGMKSGIANTLNNNDYPLMRVEEMILIQAEGLARSGNEAKARQVLEAFVKTYRDPSYSSTAGGRTLVDEIWFQRRIELWGEGFATSDIKRLGKPIVRFHGGVASNFPDAHRFNVAADDGWLNLRFPQTEMDNNLGIIDNEGGSMPVSGQNPNLRDGVTD